MPVTPEILPPDAGGIARAVAHLAAGSLVALPTETVYGLAADARNAVAVARVFKAKERPSFNPLIVHVTDIAAAEDVAVFSPRAHDLAQAFWPGPLTLVLPLRPGHGLADGVTAGLGSVALRSPDHAVAQAVLRGFGGPVAAPSANPSGRISPTRAEHVLAGLGSQVAAILDAGPCPVGVESTIAEVTKDGVRVLREGGLPREAMAAATGALLPPSTPNKVTAPGQLASHYAPQAPLIPNSALDDPSFVTVGFGPAGPATDFTLSASGDLHEAATALFAVLHQADDLARADKRAGIAVAPIPDIGLGRAINDRLRRAAAPR